MEAGKSRDYSRLTGGPPACVAKELHVKFDQAFVDSVGKLHAYTNMDKGNPAN